MKVKEKSKNPETLASKRPFFTREDGKSYLLLTGDVAAVTAAIERAEQVAAADGMMLDSAVIPNPDKRLWANIL